MDKKESPPPNTAGAVVEGKVEIGEVSAPDDNDLLGMLSRLCSCVFRFFHTVSVSVANASFDPSSIGLQAGIEATILNNGSFCYRFQYHGLAAFNCYDSFILDACRACRNGLGWCLSLSLCFVF